MKIYEIIKKYEEHFETSISMPFEATPEQLEKFGADLLKCIERDEKYVPSGVDGVLIQNCLN